ncbi:MAG: hypothetical protein UHI93_01240 [Acutalibacteraceae bacterium]|nr:hypothetical protein [Acutalibacteraceae bacterium]
MKLRKALAALALAATITTTAVPAMASEGLATATNAFGVEYQVDYVKGAANIGGRRIYFGFTTESTYVRVCGWRGGVSLRAREIADLMSYDPAWWEMYSKQFPTIEEWKKWQ